MRGRHRLAVMSGVLGLLLAPVLSGCDGSAEPQPLPRPTASLSPSSASPSPTPPVLLAAAKEKTKAGADAFVRHWVLALNYAGLSGDTTVLRELALPGCVKCGALADGIDKIYKDGGHLEGGGWTVVRTKHYGMRQGHYFLDARIDSAPQSLVPAEGAQEQDFPGAKNRLRAFVLEPAAGGWKVSELDPAA